MISEIVIKRAFPLALAILLLGIGYGIYMRSCGFGAAAVQTHDPFHCAGDRMLYYMGQCINDHTINHRK